MCLWRTRLPNDLSGTCSHYNLSLKKKREEERQEAKQYKNILTPVSRSKIHSFIQLFFNNYLSTSC